MFLTYSIVFVVLFAAELLYFRIAAHFGIVDRPNARSSHSKAVLRGGGIVFLLAAWLYAAFFGLQQWPFLVGLTLVAGVSFADDIRSLPDSVRLVAQFAAMVLLFYGWGILNWQSWWVVVLGLVLCVGITNAFNFMDGINGITGGYSLAVLLPLAWLNDGMHFTDQSLIVVTILADLVFCFFNFRPKGKARCFAGDVGSVGVAFIVVYLLGRLILRTGDFTYIVFLAVYGVDSVLTIVHRILLRENLGEAHRKHAYQLMANELRMSHVAVSLLYAFLQLLVAAGMLALPRTATAHWLYLAAVCAALGVAYIIFMRRYFHLHEEYLAASAADPSVL